MEPSQDIKSCPLEPRLPPRYLVPTWPPLRDASWPRTLLSKPSQQPLPTPALTEKITRSPILRPESQQNCRRKQRNGSSWESQLSQYFFGMKTSPSHSGDSPEIWEKRMPPLTNWLHQGFWSKNLRPAGLRTNDEAKLLLHVNLMGPSDLLKKKTSVRLSGTGNLPMRG